MRIWSLSLVFGLAILSYAPSAQAGLMDFFFPAPQDTGPSPAETLRAPFADDNAVIEDLDQFDNLQNAMPLNEKHRTNAVMIQWLQMVVPDFISYKAQGYEDQYKEKVMMFSKAGAEEYVKFLHGSNYITTLRTGRYDISGFIQDFPIVVNEGVVDGRYQWVFQTTVMVTYLEAGMNEYTKNTGESINQEYVITFHVGRVDGVKNEHGVLVESWDFKKKTL